MSLKLSREWAERAEEDYQAALALSKKRKPSFLNSVCFHSQQAAEKYFKSYLALKSVPFPKTHDLVLLKNLCAKESGDYELVTDLAIILNPYAVEFRYPGERATRTDVRRALGACREIREFLHRKLQYPKR